MVDFRFPQSAISGSKWQKNASWGQKCALGEKRIDHFGVELAFTRDFSTTGDADAVGAGNKTGLSRVIFAVRRE